MLHFYKVNFGIKIRQNIGQISSLKPKKKRYVSFCHYEGGPLNWKVVIMSSTLSFLNLMLMSIFSRIPGKHKSTLKSFNIYLCRKDSKWSIN